MTETWFVPHAALAFFALMMGILSFWGKRTPWIWGSFLIISYILAFFAKIVTPISLAPIAGLFFLHAVLKEEIRGIVRFLLVAIAIAISIGLWFHFLPGFNNWEIYHQLKLSAGAKPINYYINYDKPFIGIFVLAWGLPLLKSARELDRVLKLALPLIIGGIVLMIFAGLLSDMIKWDPKFPQLFWIFLPVNLILTCISEEAFLRGFVQNEFFRWFGKRGFGANVGAVFCTSLIFAALHIKWVPSLPFLGLVFLAGIIYGSIYQYTRSIEASIICHFLFNVTHLLFFTYPALASAVS